jgi:hypothetical protein
MSSEEKKLTFNGQQKAGKNCTWRRRRGFETTKQEAGGTFILHFRRVNNFNNFKQA